MRISFCVAFVLAMSLFGTSARCADIRTFTTKNGQPAIWIGRLIEKKDIAAFVTATETLHAQTGRPYSDILVFLDSPGGNVEEIAIGYMIFGFRMQTYVPEGASCDSLCADIWLAGSKRFVGKNAQLGFHIGAPLTHHPIPGAKKNAENYVVAISMYYSHLGLPFTFLEWVISAGRDLKILDPDTAARFRIEYEPLPTGGSSRQAHLGRQYLAAAEEE